MPLQAKVQRHEQLLAGLAGRSATSPPSTEELAALVDRSRHLASIQG